MAITEITRQAIVDDLSINKVWWGGRQDAVAFLSRLYRLDELPSYDMRYADAAGDIYQHCINNDDWQPDWVFTDPRFELATDDNKFLQFLAATVHPAIRPDQKEARVLAEMYNRHLAPDGYGLVEVTQISGRPVYAGKERSTLPSVLRHAEETITLGDKDYLATLITRIETEKDPELAIGTAKEMVEAVCKWILVSEGVEPDTEWKLPKLVNETAKILKVTPSDVREDAKAAETIRRVLGNLSQIVSGIAELRNEYGSGHGKASGRGGLGPRHARLVVGAAETLAVFLSQTYDDRGAEVPDT